MNCITRISTAGYRVARTAAAAACLTLALACSDEVSSVGPVPTSPALAKGGSSAAGISRIFFTAIQGPGVPSAIYVMKPDGSDTTRVSPVGEADGYPSATLDGRTVVFNRWVGGKAQVFSMKSDGTGVVQLTSSEFGDLFPAVSPDGKRIAFIRAHPVTKQVDLYMMRADGSDIEQLTNDAAQEAAPTFSPNGQQIAFERWDAGDREIYKVDINGTGLVNLTNNSGTDDEHPAWSPDGKLIAFVSERDGQAASGEGDIYTMKPDGSNVLRRTAILPGGGASPAWSPDSKKLVFFNWAGATPVVYTVNFDGSGLTQISQTQAYSFSWSR